MTRSPSVVQSGFILVLVFAISVGIGWGAHSVDHLLFTGLLQDDQIEVASQSVLLSSCEGMSDESAQGHSTYALLPIPGTAISQSPEARQQAGIPLLLPPTPFSERSHRPG